jgi:hypothetical protein
MHQLQFAPAAIVFFASVQQFCSKNQTWKQICRFECGQVCLHSVCRARANCLRMNAIAQQRALGGKSQPSLAHQMLRERSANNEIHHCRCGQIEIGLVLSLQIAILPRVG